MQIAYIHLTDHFIWYFLRGFTCIHGLRGVGKTTLAAAYSYTANKLGFKVYSNFPLAGAYTIDVSDLGVWNISDGCLIIDEAGIDMSNRKLLEKSMKGIKEENRKWWKLSRHYGVNNILILSQSEDYEITIRRLCERHYVMEKWSFLFWFKDWSRFRIIKTELGISQDQTEIVSKITVIPFFYLYFNRKPYYNLFNSWDAPMLPDKEFEYNFLNDPVKLLPKLEENYIDYSNYIIDNNIDVGYY